jgi:hypothetical protein
MHLLVAAHLSFSQGTPSALLDALKFLLERSPVHMLYLKIVQQILRYLLCLNILQVVKKDVLCQGIRIVVSGKIDGGDRKVIKSFLFGGIPRGSVSVNIKYETASIMTRYGSLQVHIWFYYQPLTTILSHL